MNKFKVRVLDEYIYYRYEYCRFKTIIESIFLQVRIIFYTFFRLLLVLILTQLKMNPFHLYWSLGYFIIICTKLLNKFD